MLCSLVYPSDYWKAFRLSVWNAVTRLTVEAAKSDHIAYSHFALTPLSASGCCYTIPNVLPRLQFQKQSISYIHYNSQKERG